MFSILSHSLSLFLSLHKLTAHHKSISAWRKSISRLPLLSDQKKCLILFFFLNSRAPVGREEDEEEGERGTEGVAGAESREGGE